MIDMKSRTACFTGHRELPADDLPEISKRLEDTLVKLIEQGYRYFGAGGALGFDTLAAQVVLRLRERYPQIRLILVLPCLIMPFSAIGTQQESAIKNGYRQDCPKKVISAGQNRSLFVFAANLRFLGLPEN